MYKNVFKSILVSAALGMSSLASASLIGVYGDRSGEISALTNSLSQLGHTVTNLGTDISQDLSSYDSVWGVNAFNPLSSTEQTYLTSFLSNGGGVYLTGERPCCETLNQSLTTFVNSVVVGGGVQIGGLGDQGNAATINQNAVINLANNPNSISSWNPSASGGISGVIGDNVLATSDSTGVAVAAAWAMNDLIGGAGRIIAMMDVNWFSSGSSQLNTVENIEVFLAGRDSVSVSVSEPGTIALMAIGLLGLGFSRRKKR